MVYNPFTQQQPLANSIKTYEKAQRQVAQASSGPRAHPERLKALAASRRTPRVRVEPTSEELRRALRHPNGMAFRPEGSVEWPLDRFTARRVADGSIKIVEEADKRAEKKSPSSHGHEGR